MRARLDAAQADAGKRRALVGRRAPATVLASAAQEAAPEWGGLNFSNDFSCKLFIPLENKIPEVNCLVSVLPSWTLTAWWNDYCK